MNLPTVIKLIKNLRSEDTKATAEKVLESGIAALLNGDSSIIFVEPATKRQCFVPSANTVYIAPKFLHEAETMLEEAGYHVETESGSSFGFPSFFSFTMPS